MSSWRLDTLQVRKHLLAARHLEIARGLLHVEHLDDTVVHHHGVPVGAERGAKPLGLEVKLLVHVVSEGPVSVTVEVDALSRSPNRGFPGIHAVGIVDRDANDTVDALGLESFDVLAERRHVCLGAHPSKSPRHGKNDDLLALEDALVRGLGELVSHPIVPTPRLLQADGFHQAATHSRLVPRRVGVVGVDVDAHCSAHRTGDGGRVVAVSGPHGGRDSAGEGAHRSKGLQSDHRSGTPLSSR
mmetsp:Transcript_38034/g.97217  ORF Transcript_38034/g.97217 Transcript_38034/m.97217 type:complete len:243 (+) Transcript_38034:236-964(+)